MTEFESPSLVSSELVTVAFPTEDEYVRFVEHVFDNFQGRGLELTNVPIVVSVCVKPWLLERTRDNFLMHEVTEEEVQLVRRNLRASGRKAFDPADIVNFHISGFSV